MEGDDVVYVVVASHSTVSIDIFNLSFFVSNILSLPHSLLSPIRFIKVKISLQETLFTFIYSFFGKTSPKIPFPVDANF